MGTMGQFGFFDADKRLAAISAKGDPLEMIAGVVPFESKEVLQPYLAAAVGARHFRRNRRWRRLPNRLRCDRVQVAGSITTAHTIHCADG